MMMSSAQSLLLVFLWLPFATHAKLYEPCELAKELVHGHKIPRAQILDWICLVEAESSFRTHVTGPENADKSHDHGLFQINDRYWCSPPGPHSECNVDCAKLRDENITDDMDCVRKIYLRHGFEAWVGWRNKCKNDTTAAKALLGVCDLAEGPAKPAILVGGGGNAGAAGPGVDGPSSKKPQDIVFVVSGATNILEDNKIELSFNYLISGGSGSMSGLKQAILISSYRAKQFSPESRQLLLYLAIPAAK